MRRDVGFYGILLAASLGLAYWASLPRSEGDAEKVAIVTFEPKKVTTMSYKVKDTTVAVAKRADGRFWVDFNKVEPPYTPPPPPPALPGAPAPEPPSPKPSVEIKERFLANEKIEQFTKMFAPLNALRVIGKVDDKQLEEFGLKDRTDVFELKTSDGKGYKLFLGKRGYGTKTRFALEDGDSSRARVLLVDDEGLDNLEKANLRAYDRRIVAFELVDATHALAQGADGAKAKRFAHLQRDKNGELLWTDDEENAQPKASYDGWMDRVAKLRLSGYASPDEEAKLAAAPAFLTVTFEKQGQKLDSMVFKKTPDGDKSAYWVYSDFLGVHGKLVPARVEPVEKDAPGILGAAGG